MSKWLQALIAATCMVVIVASAFFIYPQVKSYRAEAQKRDAMEKAAAYRAQRTAERVAELKAINMADCINKANQTVPPPSVKKPLTDLYDADLRRCAKYRKLPAHHMQQLSDLGVLRDSDEILSERELKLLGMLAGE